MTESPESHEDPYHKCWHDEQLVSKTVGFDHLKMHRGWQGRNEIQQVSFRQVQEAHVSERNLNVGRGGYSNIVLLYRHWLY